MPVTIEHRYTFNKMRLPVGYGKRTPVAIVRRLNTKAEPLKGLGLCVFEPARKLDP